MGDGLQGLPGRLGRYELRAVLGTGGMGRVVRAHDAVLKRDVAIKLVETNAIEPEQLAELRYLFHREARAIAALRHPSIVEIYDYSGPDASLPYLACELIEGPTLRDVLEQRGRLEASVVAALGYELAQALAHAHQRGIVHRDVKPENIFWTAGGRIVLADFGIAKAFERTAGLGGTVQFGATTLFGSPAYMAPEQLVGEAAGPASDLFSLGAVLFEALSGQQAFDGDSVDAVAQAVAQGARTPFRGDDPATRELLAMIDGLMSPQPSRRPTSADVAASRLRDVLDSLEVSDPRLCLRSFGTELTGATAPLDDDATELFSTPPVVRARLDIKMSRSSRVPLILAVLALAVVLVVAGSMLRRLGRLPPMGSVLLEGARTPESAVARDAEVLVSIRYHGRASVWSDGRELGVWEGGVRLLLPAGEHLLEVRWKERVASRQVLLIAGTEPEFELD